MDVDILMKKCQSCLKEIEIKLPVGRQETCVFCGADLHCCRNCSFYMTGSYNECRETQAERVAEKDRSNFCDYFVFREAGDDREKESREMAKKKLEALFNND